MENASTPPPPNGTRIWWRDFKGTPPFRKMKRVLRDAGFHLEIAFDENKIAHDVYVVNVTQSRS